MRLKTLTFFAFLTSLAPHTALAQEPIALRPEAVVTGDVVRFGDLVKGAGDKASTPLFRAPELGKIGTIRAETIRAAAVELGFQHLETGDVSVVSVTRKAQFWGVDELVDHIRAQLVKRDPSLADSDIVFDIPPQPFRRSGDIANTVKLPFFNNDDGKFRVELAGNETSAVVMTGVIQSRTPVPVLIRSISRGDVITPADFVMEPRPRRTLPAGVVTDPGRLGTMVARRPIKPGLIRSDDLTGRDLVERNQKVTVTYAQPGLSLTMAGKALAAGPQGALVQVQNLQSKRNFDAIVTGPGTVSAKLH